MVAGGRFVVRLVLMVYIFLLNVGRVCAWPTIEHCPQSPSTGALSCKLSDVTNPMKLTAASSGSIFKVATGIDNNINVISFYIHFPREQVLRLLECSPTNQPKHLMKAFGLLPEQVR